MKGERRLVNMIQNRNGKMSMKSSALILGTLLSLLATLVGSGILAKLLDAAFLGENSVGYGAMIVVILSSWIGALVSVRKQNGRRMLSSMAVGAAYFLVMLGVNAIFFGGQYSGIGVTALLVFCGSFLAVLSVPLEKRRGKTSKIKIPNR